MKQVLLCSPSTAGISAQREQNKRDARVSKSVIVVTPSGKFSFPVFFEVDEGDEPKHRSRIDPDDMTSEAFWRWFRQQN